MFDTIDGMAMASMSLSNLFMIIKLTQIIFFHANANSYIIHIILHLNALTHIGHQAETCALFVLSDSCRHFTSIGISSWPAMPSTCASQIVQNKL